MTQLYENILLAISGLRANKMRALLTMLGIIIGIGSVIGIVMVGDSMTNSMTSSLQEMGANTVQISLQQRESENGTSYSVYMDEEDYINDEMIEAFFAGLWGCSGIGQPAGKHGKRQSDRRTSLCKCFHQRCQQRVSERKPPDHAGAVALSEIRTTKASKT